MPGGDRWAVPQLADLVHQRMVLSIAQHAGQQLLVAFEPTVDLSKASAEPLRWLCDASPRAGVGYRVAVFYVTRACHQQRPLVWKMRIKRVPLDACPFRHHAEGGC